MNRFNLESQLASAYNMMGRPAEPRPLIGITGNYGELTCKLGEGYYQQVLRAGGTPVVLPPAADKEALLAALDRIDGLLLSGGADVNPLYVGEEPQPQLGGICRERDLPELLLTRLAANRQMPILGICRGVQVMAMALGGRVAQHISTTVKHSQEADRSEPTHTVSVSSGSTLYNIYSGEERLAVNSFHHQAVSDAGPRFRVTARAADGTIEAIESSEMKPFVGVQWHPECMGPGGLPLFSWLVAQAASYAQAQRLHDRILTLDTHCDTPMLFPQGIDFAQRNGKSLVSLPQMHEGRLDATIMVAYLPQDRWQQEGGRWQADSEGLTPSTFADGIFDQIEQLADRCADRLALARTPHQLWQNKMAGRKSIMLGIENGLALEGRLDLLEHFASRGIVYITLCHNGDNDLCDSARGQHTHGGVSAFGEAVIQRMNELGIMVDLSHAAETSFFDALHISRQPIVCSHSSCRALCDHPRNLTDEQLLALAKQGGVCQITLYPGFLNEQPTEATIHDALRHLDRAISLVGTDHVGLGTDFDGDGGVPGLAHAGELTLFTRQLLARRYNQDDIQKIWGGNFLRVMAQVQSTNTPTL